MQQTCFLVFILTLSSCMEPSADPISYPKGGSPYIKQVTRLDSTFYFLPIKDVISSYDSLKAAFYGYHFHHSFDEPNISLQAPEKPIFRLSYENDNDGYGAILILTENGVTVKQVKTGIPTPIIDDRKLSDQERKHIWFLWRYFPIQEARQTKPKLTAYFDSVISTSPELLDPAYQRAIWDKAINFGDEPFSYEKWTVPITAAKFRHFVNLINRSGYWQLPSFSFNCPGASTHPDQFALEASTPSQYHLVSFTQCRNDTTRFKKVCDELMQYAKLDKSMTLWYEAQYKKWKAH